MDGGTEGHSTIWSRLSKLFGHDDEESLEKAILEARAEGEVEPDEESMLLGILRFNDLQVQDTMTPRTDIDCVPDDMPLPDVARIIVRSGHSRIPVYHETRDNIVGIVHAKDVLHSLLDAHNQNAQAADPPAAAVMREPFFVPETKSIRTLLQEFRARKQHIAIALDEYGGTSGVVTMEDLLESIVGNMEDEYDQEEEEYQKVSDNIFILDGSMSIEDVEELLGCNIGPEEDYDTLSGLITDKLDRIPAKDEHPVVRINNVEFTVLDTEERRIAKLRADILPEEPKPEEPDEE